MKQFLLTTGLVLLSCSSLSMAQEINAVTAQNLCDAYKQVGAQDAAYKPGVDVNGNAVASADLPSSSSITVPDIIEIPLTFDLAQRLNLSMTGMEMKSTVGMVKVMKDGRVTFNDKDITNDAKTYCSSSNNADMAAPVDIGPPPAAVPIESGTMVSPSNNVMVKPSSVSPSTTTSQ